MKSIFRRVDDPQTMSRGKILLSALLFFVVTRIVCSVVIGIMLQLYSAHGIDAMAELQFAGNADRMAAEAGNMGGMAAVVLQLMIVAPLLEECAFRLGLSFRRWHVAAGAGALTLFFVSRFCAMPWAAAAGVCRNLLLHRLPPHGLSHWSILSCVPPLRLSCLCVPSRPHRNGLECGTLRSRF